MLDLTLARLAQRDREREIARLQRVRAIREATAPSSAETFIPPSPDTRPARRVRPASTVRGSL
jgi:hypothetical protein